MDTLERPGNLESHDLNEQIEREFLYMNKY